MQLSLEEIDHIAALARLDLTPDERTAFQRQLSSVLEYVAKLKAADTKDVEPMSHSLEIADVLRRDEVHACDAAVRQRLIDAFPAKEGDQLKVDAVFS